MKPIKIIPRPDGQWEIIGFFYNSEQAWIKIYPSAIDAMIAARIYAPASRVCWIAKPPEEE